MSDLLKDLAEADQGVVAAAWMHSQTGCLYETKEEVPLTDEEECAVPLFTRPLTKPLQLSEVMFEAKRALENASKAVRVLKTILSKQRLAGSEVADEIDDDIWVSLRAIEVTFTKPEVPSPHKRMAVQTNDAGQTP